MPGQNPACRTDLVFYARRPRPLTGNATVQVGSQIGRRKLVVWPTADAARSRTPFRVVAVWFRVAGKDGRGVLA